MAFPIFEDSLVLLVLLLEKTKNIPRLVEVLKLGKQLALVIVRNVHNRKVGHGPI